MPLPTNPGEIGYNGYVGKVAIPTMAPKWQSGVVRHVSQGMVHPGMVAMSGMVALPGMVAMPGMVCHCTGWYDMSDLGWYGHGRGGSNL